METGNRNKMSEYIIAKKTPSFWNICGRVLFIGIKNTEEVFKLNWDILNSK